LAPAEIAGLVAAGPNPPRFGLPAAGLPSDLLLRRGRRAALAQLAAADQDNGFRHCAALSRLTITATLAWSPVRVERLFTGDAAQHRGRAGPGRPAARLRPQPGAG
jgi:hypothetical protein